MGDRGASSRAPALRAARTDPARPRSRGRGDRPEQLHQGRTSRKVGLGPARDAPSSFAPATNRVTATESLFAHAINRLLQQYRHLSDIQPKEANVRCWGLK